VSRCYYNILLSPFTETVPCFVNLPLSFGVAIVVCNCEPQLRTLTYLLYSIKKTPWSESASELYRPSDRRLSAEVIANFCG
jgi:hypothetical protein